MEDIMKYGEDPLIEINETFDLGKGQSLKVNLVIKESKKYEVLSEIKVLVEIIKAKQ